MRLAPFVLAVGLTVLPSVLEAHSLLLESSPPADGVLGASPPEVRLRFNNRIEKKLARLRLHAPAGGVRALPPGLDGPAAELRAPVPPLAPGRYRLEWRVLSTDGHVASGVFGFRVAS